MKTTLQWPIGLFVCIIHIACTPTSVDIKPGLWEGKIPGEGKARMFVFRSGDGPYDIGLEMNLSDSSHISSCFQMEEITEDNCYYYYGSDIQFKGIPRKDSFDGIIIADVIDETFTVHFRELTQKDEKEYLKKWFLMHYDSQCSTSIISPEFDQLQSKAEELTPESDGGIGFYDYDVFLQGQEYVPIEQLDIQIEKENATIIAHRYDGAIRYCFVKREGNWLVDDIERIGNGEEGWSERKRLEQYIREQTDD